MKEYKLSDRELKELLEAIKPMPVMFASGGRPLFRGQQERANAAWRKLGEKMGFDFLTVQPVSGKSMHYFTAEEST